MSLPSIRPTLYARGTGGAPTTTLLPVQIADRLDRYEHTITARGGFETCRMGFAATLDEASWWLEQLMASVIVADSDGGVAWAGYLEEVVLSVGGVRQARSVRPMANRIRCRYTTVLGTSAVTSAVTNTDSSSRYGRRDATITLAETTAAAASAAASATLAERAWPRYTPLSELAAQFGAPLGSDVRIELTCAGWYSALDWLMLPVATTSTAVTTAQIPTLLASYNAVNAFFDASALQIAASGVSDTQYVGDDVSVRQKIDTLLRQGNSSGQRLAWGVIDESRRLTVATWAGATPNTPGLVYRAGAGVLATPQGRWVQPWQARPDVVLEQADLLDAAPVAGAADAAARYYVERVVCSIDASRARVQLEPTDVAGVDPLLARLEAGR
jgi:hypothetical protein